MELFYCHQQSPIVGKVAATKCSRAQERCLYNLGGSYFFHRSSEGLRIPLSPDFVLLNSEIDFFVAFRQCFRCSLVVWINWLGIFQLDIPFPLGQSDDLELDDFPVGPALPTHF